VVGVRGFAGEISAAQRRESRKSNTTFFEVRKSYKLDNSVAHSTYEIPSAALKKSLQRILERLPFSGETSFVSFSGESSNSYAHSSLRNCPLRVRRSTQFFAPELDDSPAN